MPFKFSGKAICKRVRPNNGIIEALFTIHRDYSDRKSNDEHILINVNVAHGAPTEGVEYLIDVRPAAGR